jgi:catalase
MAGKSGETRAAARAPSIATRRRMLGHLMIVEESLGKAVEAALGVQGQAEKITPARAPFDIDPSPQHRPRRRRPPSRAARSACW